MILMRSHKPRPEVKAGDIIGFSGDSWMSFGISVATLGIPFWDLSHVGIIGEHEGELLLFESTTLSDLACVIQEKRVSGVQAHRMDDRVQAYRGKAWLYPVYRSLYPPESKRLSSFLTKHIGKDYDTIGAVRSGGKVCSWIESLLRRQDLSSLFCSELCAAAFQCTGILPTDNASRWNPNRLVRACRRRGILRQPWRLK
jgi:hypothetical protein